MEMSTQQEKKAWLEATEEGRVDPVSDRQSNGRTLLEKILLVLVVAALVALVAILAVFIVTRKKQEPDIRSEAAACLTGDCVSTAAKIHSYIDYNTNYCDDFYQFACGRWLKQTVIPEDKSYLGVFFILDDKVSLILKNLLEESDKPTDLGSSKKAKDLYKSCMNIELINTRGNQPLKHFLTSEFGGWPLVTSGWSAINFSLVQTMIKLFKLTMTPIMDFSVDVDYKNSSKHVLMMDQPEFGMPGQKYYLVPRNDRMLKAYEELMYQVGKLLGFANPATARQEVADIVDFEIRLANISVPDEDRRDRNALYNAMTLAEVHGNYSQVFDWRTFVQSVTSQPEVGLTGVTDQEIIINASPQYFQRLNDVLSTTPPRTVANYLMWSVVENLASAMGESFRELGQVYKKTLYGTSTDIPRFRFCTFTTTSYLGLAVGRMFIKDNFDTDARNIVLEMIKRLHSAFIEQLNDVDWMDEVTKKVAREKNEYMDAKVGYPEEIMHDDFLEAIYRNYTYHKDQFFENNLVYLRESSHQELRYLRSPVNKTAWDGTPTTINAYYNPPTNRILFPAGILQPPFFSKTFPMSMNFGAIGYFIGHEITHGFDNQGRQYDKFGNVAQWWSQSAETKFIEKTNCLVQQYGNFTVPEVNMKLNGRNTLGENIADNGGLGQAFKAYRTWVSQRGQEEPPLPGLDFNHNQLFFISMAQLWCTVMTKQEALSRIKTGVHSPGRFRVIGSLQNSEDFAKVFNCPLNSPMNPEKKCKVW